jgi:hypothetical protein
MRAQTVATLAGAVFVLLATTTTVAADKKREEVVTAELVSYNEVPSLSFPASGKFRAVIDEAAQTITYTLSYQDLSSPPSQSHIHLGQEHTTGVVMVFLCSNLTTSPAGTQTCPDAPATITGTLSPADVLGGGTTGIAAGEFAELVAAIRNNAAYVNLHTVNNPAGEARGQAHR